MDAFGGVVGDEFGGGVVGVEFDLVYGGDDLRTVLVGFAMETGGVEYGNKTNLSGRIVE